jgi:hypothetical protein
MRSFFIIWRFPFPDEIPVLMKAISQKRSTSMTIETDLVIRMILRNHHLIQWALLMSPHLRVLLTSVR